MNTTASHCLSCERSDKADNLVQCNKCDGQQLAILEEQLVEEENRSIRSRVSATQARDNTRKWVDASGRTDGANNSVATTSAHIVPTTSTSSQQHPTTASEEYIEAATVTSECDVATPFEPVENQTTPVAIVTGAGTTAAPEILPTCRPVEADFNASSTAVRVLGVDNERRFTSTTSGVRLDATVSKTERIGPGQGPPTGIVPLVHQQTVVPVSIESQRDHQTRNDTGTALNDNHFAMTSRAGGQGKTSINTGWSTANQERESKKSKA
ncbi:uncharacterized protein LOC134206063 [Armigeres subalbatus]|uniref:uncharacterized protein LOC134206063 n=1 Tax=Armigeres subalbatus TaxID=124917 RepID=UPI002ED59C40